MAIKPATGSKPKVMSGTGYAYQQRNGLRTARARITGANASYKDLCEVCRNVRGKPTQDALEFLELAAVKEKAIYFARHNKGKGHRRELGGKKGGFPIKSVKIVLGVLKNAQANADKLALGATRIAHIIANKQDVYPRMSPKGRRIVHNYETAFVEIVLEEMQEQTKKADNDVKKKMREKKAREEKRADAVKNVEAGKEASIPSAKAQEIAAKESVAAPPKEEAKPKVSAQAPAVPAKS
jgi:ribosomal protein uL22